jgi:hypothetical protein
VSEKVTLTVPLSVCTADLSHVATRDIAGWVTRSASVRRREVRQREGHIPRPLNSFMLYRSAYVEKARAWCRQNREQILSRVIATSWKMELSEVRQRYAQYARLERSNHADAHPTYKFSPRSAKPAYRKKRKSLLREHHGEHPPHLRSMSKGSEQHRPPATTNSHAAPDTTDCLGLGKADPAAYGTWQPKPPETMIELCQHQYQPYYWPEDDWLAGHDSGQVSSSMDMSLENSRDPYALHDAQTGTYYASPDAYYCLYLQPALVCDYEYDSRDHDSVMMPHTTHDMLLMYDYSTPSGYAH